MDVMINHLRQNISNNVAQHLLSSGVTQVMELCWSCDTAHLEDQLSKHNGTQSHLADGSDSLVNGLLDDKFDLIVGSDIVYNEGQVQPLLDTIKHLARGPSTKILVCYEIRNEAAHRLFLEKVEQQNDFEIRRIPIKKQDPLYRSDEVLLYQLKLKHRSGSEDVVEEDN